MDLSTEIILHAYASGVFPMAEERSSADVFWVDPRHRGIIPLERFHLSRSLRREILRARYRLTRNADFAGTVTACADRSETWINADLFRVYVELHRMGHAHSVEVWEGDTLVGGIFGVAMAAAFFGESMFSRRPNTSKIALATLVAHLVGTGFRLFDTQFLTPHLRSLGGVEVTRMRYRSLLNDALGQYADFEGRALPSPQEVVQRLTHTS